MPNTVPNHKICLSLKNLLSLSFRCQLYSFSLKSLFTFLWDYFTLPYFYARPLMNEKFSVGFLYVANRWKLCIELMVSLFGILLLFDHLTTPWLQRRWRWFLSLWIIHLGCTQNFPKKCFLPPGVRIFSIFLLLTILSLNISHPSIFLTPLHPLL